MNFLEFFWTLQLSNELPKAVTCSLSFVDKQTLCDFNYAAFDADCSNGISLLYFIGTTLLKVQENTVPVVRCMESHAIFHLGVNPKRQETAGEGSRCSQTPAHPGNNRR